MPAEKDAGGTMIRLETSTGRGIDCSQEHQLTHPVLALDKKMRKDHPTARPRTDPSVSYNCHGLTFASRRAWIWKSVSITDIISDDKYDEVAIDKVIPGDIVIYYSELGEPNHSGVVVAAGPPLVEPEVCSKWAYCSEFVHGLRDCPTIYGPRTKFFRCVR